MMPQRSHAPLRSALAMSAGLTLAGTTAMAAIAAPAWSATRPHSHAATAVMHSAVTVKVETVAKYGPVLVDQAGLALYYNIADKPKHWACKAACLKIWPPLVLTSGQMAAVHAKSLTGLGTVRGPSGLQVTWHGRPLYTFVRDSKGKVTGQGIAKVWYVAQLTKAAATTASGGW